MPQTEFAKTTGLNKRTVSAFENDHQKATTIENLQKYAQVLGTSIEEIIALGREYDPCNAFTLKRHDTPDEELEVISTIDGLKERKHETKDWYKSTRIRFTDFDIIPISPPIHFKKDLFVVRLILPPKRRTQYFSTVLPCPVVGVVSSGFDIRVESGGVSHELSGAHAFQLNGKRPHAIFNDNDDQTAILYLVTKVPMINPNFKAPSRAPGQSKNINIAKAVDALRYKASPIPGQSLSVRGMAAISDTLHEKQLQEITRLKKDSSVVYWDKIEDLIGSTNTPMEEFLAWGQGSEDGAFKTSSSTNQASILYSNCGVEIITRSPTTENNDFFCGYFQIKSSGKGSQKKLFRDWQRKDNHINAFYVEHGSVRVVVGKRKRVYHLHEGDSIYLDASIGYSMKNISDKDARLFFAASPSITS